MYYKLWMTVSTCWENQKHAIVIQMAHKMALDALKTTKQVRIEDMKAQVQVLYEQLHTKDEQIKD